MELEKDESSEEINFFKQNLYIKIVFLKVINKYYLLIIY